MYINLTRIKSNRAVDPLDYISRIKGIHKGINKKISPCTCRSSTITHKLYVNIYNRKHVYYLRCKACGKLWLVTTNNKYLWFAISEIKKIKEVCGYD